MNNGGNEYILDFFRRVAKAGKLAHGYLFWGPPAVGKKDTAFWLADFLKTNPFDVFYITSEEGKRDITIDQIRKARRHLSLSPYNSPYKFAIVDRAETMNLEAANALLKTLEEPQGNTILILITSKPDFLPKTIISRLQDVRFKSIPLDKISKDFINKDYIDILKKPLNDIFKFIENIYKDESEIVSLLDSWLFWFRDLMMNKEDNKYVKILKEIQKTKDLISTTNINKRLALENLALCIKT
jgi:DNA polymerase-3 subunit delta'